MKLELTYGVFEGPLLRVVQKLSEKEFDITSARTFAKFLEDYQIEYQKFAEKRNDLIKLFANDKNDEGTEFINKEKDEKNFKKFEKEYEKFIESKVTFEVGVINIAKDMRFTASEINLLDELEANFEE